MSKLIDSYRKAVSNSKNYRMKDEAVANVGYSTGFLNFDFMNGTVVHVKSKDRVGRYYSIGIPDGCFVLLIGRSGSGKTSWAVQAASNIVRPFENSAIFHDDIEGGMTAYRKAVLTGFTDEEMQNKYLSRDTGISAENVYERIRMLHDIKMENRQDYEYDTGLFDSYGKRIFKLYPTAYLVDSIALLMPQQYTEEEEISGQMSATATARMNSQLFKRLIPLIKAANIILIGINHINKKIEINPMVHTKTQVSYLKQDETLPGGNTVVYLSNLMIRFDDGQKLKESEAFGISGCMVDLQLIKSRNNRAGQTCTLVFDQNRGFDPELSLFVMMKNEKRINGAGSYLYIGDRNDIKFSQKNLKNLLETNDEFRHIFIEEAVNLLKDMLDRYDTEDNGYKNNYSISSEIINFINEDIAA